MKPIILITSYHVSKDEQDVSICTWDYINALKLSGGVPLILPNIEGEDNIDVMIKLADGILFSGGEDVHPRYFKEYIKANNLRISDRRDSFEMQLADRVLDIDIPILGICRGMQLLNHHQAVKDIAPAFTASAYAEDGLVEAYEMEGDRFFVGVQWHPEMLFEKYPEELRIIESFVEGARLYKVGKNNPRHFIWLVPRPALEGIYVTRH